MLLNIVRPTSWPFTTGLFRYFTPTIPGAAANGAEKIDAGNSIDGAYQFRLNAVPMLNGRNAVE